MNQKPCRSWWRNCALEADSEISAIDRMEDGIAPVSAEGLRIRELISSLEMCHHKAERWVHNIIEAIGAGDARKGPGARPPGQEHPAEKIWRNACAALSTWCAGCPDTKVEECIGEEPANRLLSCLGERTPLKEWQVQRVIDRIRSVVLSVKRYDDPSARYNWILFSGGEYESLYRSECPEYYREHRDFWLCTARTVIHDWENGDAACLSLGLAIDMLWPCHWRFVENLRIVLGAIGGNLTPEQPFAACGRNIHLAPVRGRMEIICDTLAFYDGAADCGKKADKNILTLLGEPTDLKQWLAASLEKTIRLQLNPPANIRAISALSGPSWIQ
jgi:hypothetical protein